MDSGGIDREGPNNNTYLLWKRTNGEATIWRIDSNGNVAYGPGYGPYPSWIPESLSISEDGRNNLRVVWKATNGSLSVWDVDHVTLQLQFYKAYGPTFGWDPGAL